MDEEKNLPQNPLLTPAPSDFSENPAEETAAPPEEPAAEITTTELSPEPIEEVPATLPELLPEASVPVDLPEEYSAEMPPLSDPAADSQALTSIETQENMSPLPLTDEEDKWLEELLADPNSAGELQADELAMAAAGLTHPSELELEQIIQETQAESWGIEDAILESHLPAAESFSDADSVEQPTDPALDGDELLEQILSDKALLEPENELPPESTPEETANTAPSPKSVPDPLEKGRPKRKQGYGLFGLPHLAATAVWLAIIIAIGVSIGRMAWLCAADVLALGRDPITVTVTITETDNIDDVADKLKEAGLIRYPGLFKLYADITDAMEDIKPGTYTLNPPDAEEDQKNIVYDYMALVSVMSPHTPAQMVVSDLRIPEGYTCAQIFQLLEDNKVCTVSELETYVASLDAASLDYWFLEGVQWGDKYSLEGYLFPNTYDFYENDKPERVIRKLLDSFEANFTAVMKADLEALNDRLAQMYQKNGYGTSYIETHKFTIREVIIIASMIEKETANNLESFTVSSVIYNRLTDPNDYPFLNIDATIVYALGGKSDLTEEDLKIDHPYNTYTNPGLTPGAISNPSQNSIAAALDPSDTNFYFYAFDPSTGEHHFSATYQEHLDFLASLKEAQ